MGVGLEDWSDHLQQAESYVYQKNLLGLQWKQGNPTEQTAWLLVLYIFTSRISTCPASTAWPLIFLMLQQLWFYANPHLSWSTSDRYFSHHQVILTSILSVTQKLGFAWKWATQNSIHWFIKFSTYSPFEKDTFQTHPWDTRIAMIFHDIPIKNKHMFMKTSSIPTNH
jgi:hypothetical protein